MSSRLNVYSGLLLGLVAGAVVGSAAALLSAPQPGKETRTILKNKSDELVKRAEASLQATQTRLEAALGDVRVRSIELTHLRAKGGESPAMPQEILAE